MLRVVVFTYRLDNQISPISNPVPNRAALLQIIYSTWHRGDQPEFIDMFECSRLLDSLLGGSFHRYKVEAFHKRIQFFQIRISLKLADHSISTRHPDADSDCVLGLRLWLRRQGTGSPPPPLF